jgi:hypothetical protein
LKGCRLGSCGAYTLGLNDIHVLQQLVTIPGLESHRAPKYTSFFYFRQSYASSIQKLKSALVDVI